MEDDLVLAEVEESLALIVRQGHVAHWQERISAEAGLALDRAAYPILRLVGQSGALRLTEVAQALRVDVSTVSRQVKDLEQDGLIARQSDPHDGRAAGLVLTPTGHDALDRLRRARRRMMAEVLGRWSEEDRQMLAHVLRRLAADMAGYAERA